MGLAVFSARGLGRTIRSVVWRLAMGVATLLMLIVTRVPPRVGAEQGAVQNSERDWPMLGYDLGRSNATVHRADQGDGSFSGRPVWVRDFAGGDEQQSELVFNQYQPVVVGPMVYVGTSRNRMYALDTKTGGVVWTYEGGGPGMIIASPTIANGLLYYGATDGRVYALNATTGELLWQREVVTLGGFRTSPAVHAGSIYLGAENGVFYALRVTDGSVRWTYDTGAPILNSAAVDVAQERIYFANEDMYGLALDFNGDLLWRSAQFNGTSTRRFHPVITDDGDAVIFRTSPGPAHRALNGGDTLLARTAGHTVPDFTRINVWGEMYGVDLYAPYDAAAFDAEQDAVVHWLTHEYPEYQTFYVLNAGDGSKRFVPPILWSGASGDVGEAPVVAPDGTVYVRTRSYYGNFDADNTFYIFGTPAKLDLDTGRLQLLLLPEQNRPYDTGIFVIGDEQVSLSVGGDRLYLYSHHDAVGSVTVPSVDPGPVTISRDAPHSIDLSQRSTALPFGQDVSGNVLYMGAAGAAGQPAVIADDKVFFVSQGMLGMYESGFDGQTNYIAASRGTQPSTGPIAVPPTSSLEQYVTEIEDYLVDLSVAPEIRAELEAQVSDLVSGSRYAPFIQLAGKKPGYIYHRDPSEEAYILAIAYPCLSTGLQQEVKAYLEDMWTGIPDPLSYSFPYTDLAGRRRERYEIDSDAGSYAVLSGHHYNYTTVPSERLYFLWAYAHHIGDWDFVVDHWDAIVSAARSIDPSVIESGSRPHRSVNRRTAALIGYARIADRLRTAYPDNAAYETEYEWAMAAATTALQARLQWEEDHRPTGIPWSQDWIREGGGSGVFLDVGWGTGGQIPRYNGLVPAIGRVLRDHAWDDMVLQNDFVDTVIPAQHLAWSLIPGRGEIFSNLLPQAREVFLAKALVMEEEPETLRARASFPWCRGDLYYIERLALILRRSVPSPGKSVDSAIASLGDVLTYTVTVVGSGQPVSLTDPIPASTAYVPNTARHEPEIGTLDADANAITWSGVLPENWALHITFAVTLTVPGPRAIVNQAHVDDGGHRYTLSTTTVVVGRGLYLPVIVKD